MGISAETKWVSIKGEHGGAMIKITDKKVESVIGIPKPSLAIIVHEITELEITYLLLQWGFPPGALEIELLAPSHTQKNKTILKMLQENFGGFNEHKIDKGDKILISHIISPYGHCLCLLPRSKVKPTW